MNTYDDGFRFGFLSGRVHERMRRDDEAELRRPINLAAMNPPKLLALVRCEARRPFYLAGREVKVGEVVRLQRHDAVSLQAIGKLKILEV